MTKWNYVLLIEWLFISLILHHGCPEDFVRDFCLETAINFAWREIACEFTLEDAISWLGSEKLTCLQKCQGKIYDVKKRTWISYRQGYQPKYRLKSLLLRFDGLSKDIKTIDTLCGFSYYEEKTLEIICKTGFKNENIKKDLCTSTKNCEDPSKSCLRSLTEEIGVCKCRDGYIRFGNNCFKGNLQLNESCQRSVQCSGTVGSECQKNACVCRPGYITLNDSSCFSQNITKDLCTSTKNCEDPSKSCSRSYREEIGVCKCRDGYIRFGNNCFKGNLQLNESCQRNVQCSGTVGSVCQNNKCVCRSGYIPLNDSSCFSPDISDDLCTSHEACRGEKICSIKGQVGICICKSGFIGFGNDCLKGNLSLNESCQRNEQCSMVLGSICENNTCACRDGYVSFNNDSECSLPLPGSNSQASVQDRTEDSVVGLMVGAVFGGLIFGIVLTVLGVICYKNIRNRKPKNAKKDDQTAVVFNNTSYETERGADQNRFAEQRTNEKQIVNVPPFAHSIDLPGTINARTHHGNKSSMMKSYDVNDDVYNHLHEKEEDSENDETYDHAHGNINSAMDDSDYSNLNTGIRYKETDVSPAEVNDYDDREPPGDYCALKKQ